MARGLLHKIILLFGIYVIHTGNAVAQSQGPNNPGTVTNGACSFSYSSVLGYAPTGNVVSSNNVYASVSHCACCDANTACLTLSNFGFTIPVASVITGITVQIEKRAGAGFVIQDNGLRLMKGGVEAGSNLANFGVNWPTIDAISTYGGCNNLWGTTWTVADINASNFGVYFASIDYSCSASNASSFIDHVRVTVCYTSTLPVSLTSLYAKRLKTDVELHWETKSEIHNDYFEIERSADGVHYESVGQVDGAGDSNEPVYYTFTDKQAPTDVTYYRLTQHSFNGEIFTYDPVAVDKASTPFEVDGIYTSAEQITFRVCSEENTQTTIKILSMQGVPVYVGELNIEKGCQWHTLSIGNMSEALYVIQLSPEAATPVCTRFYYSMLAPGK